MPTAHQLRRFIAAGGVTALVALPMACASSAPVAEPAADSAVTTPSAPAGGYEVRTHTETLVDTARPTEEMAGTGVPAGAERVLDTTFTYPDAAGPFPLIAFAHGNAGHPRKFSQLFETWAAAGFVVVAPAFPHSNDEVPGTTSVFDLPRQPGDVSFAISAALRMTDEPEHVLHGRVDPDQIGVGGLSLGGATSFMVAFDACCRDDRIDAAMVMDGYQPDADGLDLGSGLPLLIMHADGDPILAYRGAEAAFAAAAPPKYLVTIHEAAHATPYENTPDPADQMVLDTTTAFWRLYLLGDPGAAGDLRRSASVPGLTTLVEAPG